MARKLTLEDVENSDSAYIYLFGEPCANLYEKQKDFSEYIEFSRQINKFAKSCPCLFKDEYESAWVAFETMPTPSEIHWEYVRMLRKNNV
jgi:hypothetical protein